MSVRHIKDSILVIVLLLSPVICHGQQMQDTTFLFRIETNDGNEYIGHILQKDSLVLQLKTQNIGVVALKLNDIRKIVAIQKEEIKDGVVWYQILQSTRYFWSPNGYGLRKGEAYYQNIWVLYNQMSFGISNRISLGLGMLPLFLFAGAPTPVWIMPKVSLPVIENRLNVGVGALSGVILGESSTGFGIVYGITTIGSHDNNVTLGLGYGYADKSWSDRPLVTLSGMVRTGKKGFMMMENYIFSFSDSWLVLSVLGGRSIIRKAGLDYGLALPFYSGMSSFTAIPWLGITIPIESKKH